MNWLGDLVRRLRAGGETRAKAKRRRPAVKLRIRSVPPKPQPTPVTHEACKGDLEKEQYRRKVAEEDLKRERDRAQALEQLLEERAVAKKQSKKKQSKKRSKSNPLDGLLDQVREADSKARLTITSGNLKLVSDAVNGLQRMRTRPVLDTVEVWTQKGSASFYSTDLNESVLLELELPENIHGDGRMLISRPDLKKLLKTKRALFDLREPNGEGMLEVECWKKEKGEPSSISMALGAEDPDDYPTRPRVPEQWFPAPGLLAAMVDAKPFVSDNLSQPMLMGVDLDFRHERVMATDGKRLMFRSFRFDKRLEAVMGEVLVPFTWKPMKSRVNCGSEELAITEKHVWISLGELTWVARIDKDYRFPPVDQLNPPKQSDYDATVLEMNEETKRVFLEVCDLLKLEKKKDDKTGEWKFPPLSVFLHPESDENAYPTCLINRHPEDDKPLAEVIKPEFSKPKRSGSDHRVIVNFDPDMIYPLLKNPVLERLVVRRGDQVTLWAGQNFEALVMPVAI